MNENTAMIRPRESNFERDLEWSNRFMPEIKRIVGPHLLETASLDQDRNEASDLVVNGLRIACRVRGPVQSPDYLNQFTLRSRRSNGKMTEFEKIILGHGNLLWLFVKTSG